MVSKNIHWLFEPILEIFFTVFAFSLFDNMLVQQLESKCSSGNPYPDAYEQPAIKILLKFIC